MTDAAAPVPYEPLPRGEAGVGDAERFEAATALGEHFAAGRLDQVEYDARVQAAYAGRTRADLQVLFTDLPEPAPFRPARPPASAGWAAPAGPPGTGPAAVQARRSAWCCCWWCWSGSRYCFLLPGLPVLPAAVVRLGPARLALGHALTPPVRASPAGRSAGTARGRRW